MDYETWKRLSIIIGEDTKKVVRDFELNNPGLAAYYRQKRQEEVGEMQQIMKEPDRTKRWKQIAKSAYAHDTVHMARRERENR